MRYIIHICIAFMLFIIASASYASEPISACTMQYAPVCGSVQVQCIRAPCYPVRQTFGNQCMANMANATNITVGECGAIPGGDVDIHGCIASAGYRWESRVKQCLRPWESRVRIMYVAPNAQGCTGISLAECLQIRLSFQRFWTNLVGSIAGFDYARGYIYRLLVLETRLDNLSLDSPTISYSLIRVLSKKPVIVHEDPPFIGDWKLTSFNSTDVSSGNFFLTFTEDRFSLKLCNNISGGYSLSGNRFVAPNSMSTMMYCEGLPMTLENAWSLDGATYSLIAIRRMTGSIGPTMQVTITMKNGNIFTFSN